MPNIQARKPKKAPKISLTPEQAQEQLREVNQSIVELELKYNSPVVQPTLGRLWKEKRRLQAIVNLKRGRE